jgi:hypothetical protein
VIRRRRLTPRSLTSAKQETPHVISPRHLTRLLALAAFALASAAAPALAPASAAAQACPGDATQECFAWWHVTTLSAPPGRQVVNVTTTTPGGPSANEIQEVFLDPFVSSGTFTLTSQGETTSAIPFEAGPSEVQSALEALSSVGSANVSVTGSAGGPWSVEFTGALADTDVAQLSGDAHGLTGESKVIVQAVNLGDVKANANEEPVTIADHLPPGLEATQIFAYGAGPPFSEFEHYYAECTLATTTCEFPLPVPPYGQVDLSMIVKETSPGAGTGTNEVTVSGGTAHPVTSTTPLTLAGPPQPFGLAVAEVAPEEANGAPVPRAGSHPFQTTTTLALNLRATPTANGSNHYLTPMPLDQTKDSRVNLPPGMLGNVATMPKCKLGTFLQEASGAQVPGPEGPEFVHCPSNTIIGVASPYLVNAPGGANGESHDPAAFVTPPLYNLEPGYGEPARFGFPIPPFTDIILDTSLRSGPGGDYGVTFTSPNIPQLVRLAETQVTLWGDPTDPRHDHQRSTSCLYGNNGIFGGKSCPASEALPPFLFMPTSCANSLQTSFAVDSWEEPGVFSPFSGEPLPSLEACNRVPFTPTMAAEPTAESATSPTGFNTSLDIADEGLNNPTGIVQSEMKKAVVTLPEGFTTNPSVAAGLGACTEAAYESETVNSEAGTGCPPDSKIGNVEIESPLVSQKVRGSLFLAKQTENPFHSLLALYMVLKNPEMGVLIKAAGKIEANPVSGQLITTFDNLPQLPFSHFSLRFRQGQRSPLITPAACGTYTVKAELYPYSNPEAPVTDESPFKITKGPEGQPCPSGGLPPFHPGLVSGSINNAAGHFSPFYVRITRRDSEQEITHFSIKLPPGVLGKLAGIPLCTDAQVAAAKSREHPGGGAEEQAAPSCSPASIVGHTLVEFGVGSVLAQAPGKVYLAGPYHNSAVSVVAITNAVIGPFDLGTVVVREALRVNPETGEVFVDATGSDPIPHIVDGIPTHLRTIRLYMDRPEFVLNPTGCEPTSTATTVLGSGLDFSSEADDQPVTVTTSYQAAGCNGLKFAPEMKLTLIGKTNRGAHPALQVEVTGHPGETNTMNASVLLPHAEFLENAHIRTVCTRVEFARGVVPGEKCPPGSIYGFARATTPILSEPLEGPVFLRSSEHPLPDLVAALRSGEINIDIGGRVDSVNGGIRTRFENLPDAPISTFTLTMEGGEKSLLVNSSNICMGSNLATVELEGHNGLQENLKPPLSAHCKSKKHGKKGKRHGKRHHHRARVGGRSGR